MLMKSVIVKYYYTFIFIIVSFNTSTLTFALM